MEKVLVTMTVNNNEVRLVNKGNQYFIHWGEKDKLKSIQELRTPTGRKPSEKSAHKKFLEAIKATQYLKFNRL
jgi:predicted ATP-binding protein involved in virulence